MAWFPKRSSSRGACTVHPWNLTRFSPDGALQQSFLKTQPQSPPDVLRLAMSFLALSQAEPNAAINHHDGDDDDADADADDDGGSSDGSGDGDGDDDGVDVLQHQAPGAPDLNLATFLVSGFNPYLTKKGHDITKSLHLFEANHCLSYMKL